jgi:hypothetical protein
MVQFGAIEVEDEVAQRATDMQLVKLLIARGATRVTATRMVEIYRKDDGPSRARRHTGRGQVGGR